MSAAAIIATLELNRGKFKTEIEATNQDLVKSAAVARETAAAVAILERELQNDKGNKALKANLTTLKKSLDETERGMKTLEAQKRRLNNALGETPAPKAATEEKFDPIVYDDERASVRRRSEGGEGGDNSRMNNMEAGHSIRSVFGSMGAGQGIGQSLQMELPRLLQAAGTSLGAMIGIEAATGIVASITAGIEKAKELKKALGEALSGGGGGTGYASSGALNQQIDALAQQRDKMMGDESVLDKGGNLFKNFYRAATSPKNHQTVESERDANIQELENRRLQISDEIVKRKGEQVALDQRAAAEGEDAVAVDRERLALKEKIQAVQDDKNMDAMAQAHLIDLLKIESAERERQIKLVQQKKDIEDNTHHADSMDRSNGADTAVSKAENALKEAKAKRDLLPSGSKEWVAAADDITDKQSDVDQAKREQARHAAERRDAGREAAMTGTDAARQRQAMEDEKRRIQAQLDPNSDTYEHNNEKRKDISGRQLPEIDAKLRSEDQSDAQRAFDRRKNDIASREGVGTGQKLKSIDERLGLNNDEQAYNSAHKKDPDIASRLTAEAAELNRQRKDIEISAARELANAKAQTKEAELQRDGQKSAAQIEGIRAQYEERIAAAIRDGKSDLAEQLTLHEKIAVQAAQLANFRKTAAQKSDERLAAQKDEQDRKQMLIQQKKDFENKRTNYEDEHRASLDLDPAKRAAQIAAAVPDINGLLSKTQESTTAKESSANASDAAFDARFHKNGVSSQPAAAATEPDRRATAQADPQQQASQNDSNIGDVVDVLEDIKDVLDDRLKLTIP